MRVLVTGGSGLVGRYVVDEMARIHSVEVLDVKQPHRNDIRWHRVDLLDFDALCGTLVGFEAVVHLAGIPHPLNDSPEEVFRTNALGTFHILEASARNQITNFVFMSSESTLGFAFAPTRISPDYLPVDERHPLRPQDAYGLSKVVGEQLCAAYSAKAAMRTICLRAPWIWVPEDKEKAIYRQLVSEYHQWHKSLWAFIHVLDVAEAVKLTLEYRGNPPHDVFFICADENWTGRESRELISEFYRDVKNIAPGFDGTASLISNGKAKSVLGFKPRNLVRDILKPQKAESL